MGAQGRARQGRARQGQRQRDTAFGQRGSTDAHGLVSGAGVQGVGADRICNEDGPTREGEGTGSCVAATASGAVTQPLQRSAAPAEHRARPPAKCLRGSRRASASGLQPKHLCTSPPPNNRPITRAMSSETSPEEQKKLDAEQKAREQAEQAALPYKWDQTIKDLDITVPIEGKYKGKDLDVKISRNALRVGIKGQPPVIDVRYPQQYLFACQGIAD